MAGWLGWLVTVAGAAVTVLTLRDIFRTLWYPSGQGDLSSHVMRLVWRLGRRRRRAGASGILTGPLALAGVIAVWLLLLVLGGALLYAPHLPEGFAFSSSLDRAERGGVLDAVYVSMVTVATLGFGDVLPTAAWLRIAVPLQAVFGFALLTASVTWVLQVYPALIRRRSLAVRLSLLRRSATAGLLDDPGSASAATLLDGLSAQVVQARVDLTEYAETYYFREGSTDASLPAQLGVAVDLVAAGRAAPRQDVRVAAEVLDTALGDLARIIDEQFLGTGQSAAEVLRRYADDHHQDQRRWDPPRRGR
ncbi:potassium channel family protein [Blastococcus sp. BMG 814]|uniref:Potassium channel family protein n=1 Tax=Blastococcus carthaginiensis TaxID=3050034 RepID=A0ABT9I966_9ACTN|nr:potassium channel family protein [Blastococcus carthaginiensis]MDP5182116.1 potassium channel family protein [Blastococcus carthaginiensis]